MKNRKYSLITQSLLIVLGLVFLTAAKPERVVVNEAIPNEAEQGTINLDVAIKGGGFAPGATVAFWRTGTTNPGGITVKSVTVHDSQNITANVDIDSAADIDAYDIEVQVSRGRKGKGTELFSVKLKGGGNEDTTPPAPIQDFRAVGPLRSTSTEVAWTAPGDDGTNGSVDHYVLLSAAQADLSMCDGPGPYDFSNARVEPAPPTTPANWSIRQPIEGLIPATCYAFELEAFDEAGNSSGPAYATEVTLDGPDSSSWIVETVAPDAYRLEIAHDPNAGYQPVVFTSNHSDDVRFYRRAPDGTWSYTNVGKGCCSGEIDLEFDARDNTFGALFRGRREHPFYADLLSDGSWDVTKLVRDSADFSNEALQFNSAGEAVIALWVDSKLHLAAQSGSSFNVQQVQLPDGSDLPSGRDAILRFQPGTGHPVIVYETNRQFIYIASFDGVSWSLESMEFGTDPGFQVRLSGYDYDSNGEPIMLISQELGVPYEYWPRMLRQDASGAWDPANATSISSTTNWSQTIAGMLMTSDGTIYVTERNDLTQVKVGKFCEANRGFSCSPTMDATGTNNIWLWELIADDVGLDGRGIAVDEVTGAIAAVAQGSDPTGENFYYYRCDPSSASAICGNPPSE